MRIVRVDVAGRRKSAESIFVGHVETQTIVDVGRRDLRLIEVHYKDGGRNRLHTHTTDQILVITEGEGIVATSAEEHRVGVGDVAYIPAGEQHWHGAQPGKDMTHLAINGGASKTTIVDRPEAT
ncbi:MAG: cupin domain-containing protein [Lysobacteraceae bacterium]|nr:MAG: cupin domain-containing protein [Xanthomonadaceae bacterium]